MEILNLLGNNGTGAKRNARSRAFIGIGVIAAAVGLSSTLAANISINSGPVEFGQGVAQTVACSGDESIIVTPATSFSNEGADINTIFTEADSLWLYVTSTKDINVGMIVTAGDGWIEPNTVVTGIDGDRNVYISKDPQGSMPPGGVPVTFSESRGIPVTRIPDGAGADPSGPGSLYEIDSTGLTEGMVLSGEGISAGTVITRADPNEIYTNKPDSYTSGDPITFTNSRSGVQGSFKLSDITVSGIPDTCNGKVFTIKLYDNESSEPLRISNFGEGNGDSSVQVWWANSYGEVGQSTTNPHEAVVQFPADYRVFGSWWEDAYNSGYAVETAGNSDLPNGAFKINLPVTVDASRVYKITIESQDDSDSLNVDDSGSGFYDWWSFVP